MCEEPLTGNMGGDSEPHKPVHETATDSQSGEEEPERALTSLHHLIDLEWMLEAYRLTRKDGAPGIDGVTAADYEANLEANLWTSWSASNPAVIVRRRSAEHTFPKRTARRGCSAFQPSKTRWRNAP